jgi:hypothetical protein
MISQEAIEEFWANSRDMYARGQAPFDIDDTCLWSYFFVDPSKHKLAGIAEHLEAAGYRVWGYLEPGQGDQEPAYFLRVDRVERHTISSLLARNAELYAVAAKFGAQDYDGMDVGAEDAP